MAIDLQQAVKLHKILQTQLLQTESMVANLVNTLKSNSRANIAEINRMLGTITANNQQISQTMLHISAKLLENEHHNTDPKIKAELTLAMHHNVKIRCWITAWPQVEGLVRMQVPARRRKLFHKASAANDITISQLSAYDAAFEEIRKLLNTKDQGDDALDHGCFSDISFPNSIFLENVHATYRLLLAQGQATQSQFIDVGCGSGLKVLQASHFFKHTDGLEYDEGYANLARQLLEQASIANCRVIHGDGITFDYYGNYNVVYFYRPMHDNDMLKKLEYQITNTVEPETLLIAPYEQFLHRHKELGCAHIGGSVYLAKSSQSQANALRRKAELTGTFYHKLRSPSPSIWDPIINFSHENGFGLIN